MIQKLLLIGLFVFSISSSFASQRGDFFNVIGTLEGKLYVDCSLSSEGERIVKESSWKKIPFRGNFILVRGDQTIQKEILVDERPGFFKGKWAQMPTGHHKIGFVDDRGDIFEIFLTTGVSENRASLCILDVEELKEISRYEFNLP